MFSRKRILWLIVIVVFVGLALLSWNSQGAYWRTNPRISNMTRIGWIGIAFDGVRDPKSDRPNPSALRVVRVIIGGPADQAGMQVGDILVGLNGQPFANPLELQDKVARMRVGDSLSLDVHREGETFTIEMRLVSWQEIVNLSHKTPGDGLGL
jgi:S1-C subfamily serine protease